MATMALEKGMPIEQVQKLLGHSKIDTTLHYATVNQTNVSKRIIASTVSNASFYEIIPL